LRYVSSCGCAFGISVMKFTLTFDGDLPPSAGSSRKTEEKWSIREAFSPQMKDLWNTHPTLKVAQSGRYVPKNKTFWWNYVHHSADTTATPNRPRADDDLDLCEEIEAAGGAAP
jgi:hypothetical protein